MSNRSRFLNISETFLRDGFHLCMGCRQVAQNTEILSGLSATPTNYRPGLSAKPSQTRNRALTGHDGSRNPEQNATINPLKVTALAPHSGAF